MRGPYRVAHSVFILSSDSFSRGHLVRRFGYSAAVSAAVAVRPFAPPERMDDVFSNNS